jgi:hypothetical protein
MIKSLLNEMLNLFPSSVAFALVLVAFCMDGAELYTVSILEEQEIEFHNRF